MQIPVEISFRGLPAWERAEEEIRTRAASLEKYCENITSCRVVVEAPHLRHSKGQLYHVSVDLTVPGREIVVRRDPAEHHAHEDLYQAIRDAFSAARRQLQDYVRERRGQTKHREPAPHGRVLRLFPEEGYGFIETPDGREIYFHRNALLQGAFEELAPGDEVRFHEEAGEKGPQATSLRLA